MFGRVSLKCVRQGYTVGTGAFNAGTAQHYEFLPPPGSHLKNPSIQGRRKRLPAKRHATADQKVVNLAVLPGAVWVAISGAVWGGHQGTKPCRRTGHSGCKVGK